MFADGIEIYSREFGDLKKLEKHMGAASPWEAAARALRTSQQMWDLFLENTQFVFCSKDDYKASEWHVGGDIKYILNGIHPSETKVPVLLNEDGRTYLDKLMGNKRLFDWMKKKGLLVSKESILRVAIGLAFVIAERQRRNFDLSGYRKGEGLPRKIAGLNL